MNIEAAIGIVESFDPGADGVARKSRELTLQLLTFSPEPFSRLQFEPGHVTCTALVLHPDGRRAMTMHHHRLRRWLLPGGHVEPEDGWLADAAAREAAEETRVRIDLSRLAELVGIDVHGIPPKRGEPFHLHHDLIWRFHAADAGIARTDEALDTVWANESDWERLGLADSIRNAIARATAE